MASANICSPTPLLIGLASHPRFPLFLPLFLFSLIKPLKVWDGKDKPHSSQGVLTEENGRAMATKANPGPLYSAWGS